MNYKVIAVAALLQGCFQSHGGSASGPGKGTEFDEGGVVDLHTLDGGLRAGDPKASDAGRTRPIVEQPAPQFPKGAMRFRGGSWATARHAEDLNLQDYTLEFWIRQHGTGHVLHKGSPSRSQYDIFLEGDTRYAGVWPYPNALKGKLDLPNAESDSFGVVIPRNNWTHIAWVVRWTDDPAEGAHDGGGLLAKLYVDGVDATKNVPWFVPGAGNTINEDPFVFGQGFEGDLAEVSLWDLPRTDAEIARSAAAPIDVDAPGLIAYWPLNDGGYVAYDRSGWGHNATLGSETRLADLNDPEWISDGPFLHRGR